MTRKRSPKEENPLEEILANQIVLPDDFEVASAPPLTFNQDDHVKDYETARQTTYDLIVKGNQALEMLIERAASSDTSRPFEVIAILIKTIADTNAQLLDIQSKYKKLSETILNEQPEQRESSTIVRMSMPELLDAAKKKKA